jgi:creatinine amidohydrolase/Fe(II)-dependent formamide hydrolase-like protein
VNWAYFSFTSYLLAVDPKMIRHDKITEFGNDPEENLKLGFAGDPSMATVEIGKRMIASKIIVSVDQITKLKKENRE